MAYGLNRENMCSVAPVARSGSNELAHVALIAQALKTCTDELSMSSRFLGKHVQPI